MIQYTHKVGSIPVSEYVFDYESGIKNLYQFRRYRHLYFNKKPPLFVVKEKEHTLIVDLIHNNNNDLWMKLTSNSRNHIRRAYRSEIECIYEDNPEIFYSLYRSFTKIKNLSALPQYLFKDLTNHLKFSRAMKENHVLASHCYLLDHQHKKVRLFCSASPRLEKGENEVLIGIANKLLTYEDMLYFRSQGFSSFDFGGYALGTNDHQLQGINRFKKMFGGELHQLYTYYSIPYYLLNKLSEWKQRLIQLKKKV